jgi:YVTN family beta-propeller protein
MRSRSVRARCAPIVAALLAGALFAGACSDSGAGDLGKTAGRQTCGGTTTTRAGAGAAGGGSSAAPVTTTPPSTTMPFTVPGRTPLAGMPPLTDAKNVYAAAVSGLADGVKDVPPRIYVPNNDTNNVTVIDPATFKVIDEYPTGRLPQHVVPSWDMQTLWVNNNSGNTLTAIDPRTGKPTRTIPVEDPYNLYFTPDGKYAMVMEERNNTITFRDAHTPNLDVVKKVRVPCKGVNHADFSPDGTYLIASCEFSGELLKVDTAKQEVVGKVTLDVKGSMPQDVRLTPDGTTFLVADMTANGVWLVDGEKFEVQGLVPTGKGAHGIYPSRDATEIYVSNRSEGSISVLDAATKQVVRTWRIPGGGSPDMGGVSADGKVLWMSGRSNNEVYAIDVVNWTLLAKIKVGGKPHGLAVFPQPGRYSLGHTGNYR